MTARHVVDGGDPNGTAEPKEACSHWITVDKLVEAGAMVVLKGGKKVLLEPLPAFEEAETQVDAESTCHDSGLEVEEVRAEREEVGESVVVSAGDGGEKNNAMVSLEEIVSEHKDVGSTLAGKRRRADGPVPLTASSDASAAKRTARADVGSRQERVSPGIDSQSLQPVPETLPLPSPGIEGLPPLAEHRAGSEPETEGIKHSDKIEGRGVTARCPVQQQDRLLPSVHIPEKNDACSRYPIRGRLRRQTQPAFEDARAIQRKTSMKRQRLASEIDRSLVITVEAGSDSSSGTEQAHNREAEVAGAGVRSIPSGTSDRVPAHEASLAPASAKVTIASVDAPDVHARASSYGLEPGWPDGMQLLGQVPVMCVRAISVRSDGDAMYYASAFKDAESAVGHSRSVSRFSFHFEDVEELSLDVRGEHARRHDTIGDSMDSHRDLSPEPDEKQRARESEGITQGDTRNGESRQGEAPHASRVETPRPQIQEEAEHPGETVEDHVLPDDGMEEGEIDALPERQAGTILSANGTATQGSEGDSGNVAQAAQETTTSGGITAQTAATATSNEGNRSSAASIDDKHIADVEEMEISSDDASYCGFEDVEPALLGTSDDEASDAGTHVAVGRGGEDAVGHSNVETKTNVPVLSGVESAPLQSSPSAATKHKAEVQMKSAAGGEQPLRAESCGGSTSGDENEMPAVEREPESVQSLPPRETEAILSLRSIVRKQLQGVLRSASKGKEAAKACEDASNVIEEIADGAEEMLFRLLYKDSTGGREYKVRSVDAYGSL